MHLCLRPSVCPSVVKTEFLTVWSAYDNLWQLMTTYDNLWQLMTAYDSLWQLMTAYDNLWKLMTTYDSLWQLMTTYNIIWQLLTTYNSLWQLMTTYDNLWQLMTAYDIWHMREQLQSWHLFHFIEANLITTLAFVSAQGQGSLALERALNRNGQAWAQSSVFSFAQELRK